MHVMHGPSLHIQVLNLVDLLGRTPPWRPTPRPRCGLARVDQRDAGTVDTGNGLMCELGHIAEHCDHAASACHDPGYPGQRGIQVDLVRFALRGGQIELRLLVPTGLGVVISHAA